MKKLYIKFLILLINKPFLHMALSTLIIIIIRILFIDIVYASEMQTLRERMEQSVQMIYEPLDKLSAEFLRERERQRTIYESANPDVKIEGNTVSEKESDTQEANPSTMQSNNQPSNIDPMSGEYIEIIQQFTEIVSQVESKRELIEQSLNFVRTIIPNTCWARNPEELKHEDTFIQHHLDALSKSVTRLDDSDEEYFKQACREIYSVAIMSYNVGNVMNKLDNYEIVEKIFTYNMKAVLGEEATEKYLAGLDTLSSSTKK